MYVGLNLRQLRNNFSKLKICLWQLTNVFSQYFELLLIQPYIMTR